MADQTALAPQHRPLDGRTVIVTGAGQGLGRAYALHLADLGAAVVVNDLAPSAGQGAENSAVAVVKEIRQRGGRAEAVFADIGDWTDAGRLIDESWELFGQVDALVNNAGNLRDRTMAKMSEQEWDAVARVHLRGHAACSHHAMRRWVASAKEGRSPTGALVHTTSISAFTGIVGQGNYTAAKLGIVGLSRVLALEGARYGIRSNAIAPSARTRLAVAAPGAERMLKRDERGLDTFDPANVAPVVGWLCAPGCRANGQVFQVYGSRVSVVGPMRIEYRADLGRPWTAADLEATFGNRYVSPPALSDFVEELFD